MFGQLVELAHVLVYVGERVTVEVQGQTWREETCQRCGGRFHYRLTVTATGAAVNPYFIDSYGSRRRAEDEARSELDHALEHMVAPVPCPHCLKYQEGVLPELRASRLLRVRWAGRFLVVLGALPLGLLLPFEAMIILSAADLSRLNWPAVAATLGAPASVLAAGLGLLLARRRRLAAYDPNADEYAADRRRLAAERALTPEAFERLRIPVPPPGLARLGRPPRPGQLVGKPCVRCGDRITSDIDGRYCSGCGWPVHNSCAAPAEGGCPQCGAGAGGT